LVGTQPVDAAKVEPCGLRHDRGWLSRDLDPGALTAREKHGLIGVTATPAPISVPARIPGGSMCRGCSCCQLFCDGNSRLVDAEEGAVQAALGEVAFRPFDPTGGRDAAGAHRLEACDSDQAFDLGRRGAVIGGVEQDSPRFAPLARASAPRVPNALT
jgi:hypothetical protein